ncbi:hypothetical protein, partial [Desertivirga xinjiangensis]|uniref:hypothetical protein n=1 Tax=Desertivirga xinjiangensis TaxID=539206 RepID=UPI002109DDDE
KQKLVSYTNGLFCFSMAGMQLVKMARGARVPTTFKNQHNSFDGLPTQLFCLIPNSFILKIQSSWRLLGQHVLNHRNERSSSEPKNYSLIIK